MSLRLLFPSLTFLLTACASGGEMPPGGGDGDAAVGVDASRTDAGTITPRDAGRRDAGRPLECDVREHLCGSTCEIDGPNDPATGCANSCDGAPCPVPELGGIATCTTAGACDWDCMPPAMRVGDTCECGAATCDTMACGMMDDGCGGMVDCGVCPGGATCTDNRCGCAPDGREPNDTHTAVTSIASLDDAGDATYSLIDVNIDNPGDEDWFRFEGIDGDDGGNPQITVTLDGIPTGDDYDLAAYYACHAGDDLSSCTRGTVDNTVGHGCASVTAGMAVETVEIASDCSGLDFNDDGAIFVHVTPRTVAGMCATYRIQISVR